MQALISSRDKRAAPLFARILENDDHRRRREALYLSAIDSLGKIGGDSESVEALKHVLYRGEWWAPRRTERFRAAAAAALRTAGSAAAQQALQEAATHASRGVRRIAQSALTAQTPRPAARKSS
jgi:HEAT repeat protein